jgi:DNA-binding CsgD family transcriptional regulator
MTFFSRYKLILLYAFGLGLALFLMKWLEFRLLVVSHSMEIYIGVIAILFTALGIWLAVKLVKPKVQTVHVEKEVVVEKEVLVEKEVWIEREVVIEKEVIVEKEIRVSSEEFVFNEKEAERLGLSKRELEVLALMAQGLSNQEIADRMFVSLNTIKTHTSNIFSKLDVKRRTAAIETARKLMLVR